MIEIDYTKHVAVQTQNNGDQMCECCKFHWEERNFIVNLNFDFNSTFV